MLQSAVAGSLGVASYAFMFCLISVPNGGASESERQNTCFATFFFSCPAFSLALNHTDQTPLPADPFLRNLERMLATSASASARDVRQAFQKLHYTWYPLTCRCVLSGTLIVYGKQTDCRSKPCVMQSRVISSYIINGLSCIDNRKNLMKQRKS